MLTMCYVAHVISEVGDVILILWGKLRLQVGNCPKSPIYEVKSRSTQNLSDDLDFWVQPVCVCVCVCVWVCVVCLSLCVFQSRVQPVCVWGGMVCLSLCVFQSSFVLRNNVREITVLISVIFPPNQSKYIPSTIFREAGSLFYVTVTSTLVERLTLYGLKAGLWV